MSVNLKKFVTNSLPEFLMLATSEPNVTAAALFADDAIKSLWSVVVCYDVQNFYKNYASTSVGPIRPAVGLDEFVAYCDSKIQSKCVERAADYSCCMTVSDLMRMEPWALLYERVGSRLMKFLLFSCMLFVPVQRDGDGRISGVYYCVDSPSSPSTVGRYEVLKSFWAKAGWLWAGKKTAANDDGSFGGGGKSNRARPTPPCYDIAGLLTGVDGSAKRLADADSMLLAIWRTDVGSKAAVADHDEARWAVLKRKLQTMVDKSSGKRLQEIYKNIVGPASADEIPLSRIKKFAMDVVRKTVPRELFGTAGNRDQYLRNLCAVLNCGKTHRFTVHRITHRVGTKRVKWLQQFDAAARIEIMAKTLVWLTNRYVFGKITRFVRIVATNGPNHGVAYFAKSAWSAMCDEKIRPLTNAVVAGDEYFKEEDDDRYNGCRTPTAVGHRHWRAFPYAKPRGVRLIFKLRQRRDDQKALMDKCLAFLRGLLDATYGQRFRSVAKRSFFDRWIAAAVGQRPAPVYYVRADFRDAFTSVRHQKLLEVLRAAIKTQFGVRSQNLRMHTVDVVKAAGNRVYCKKRRFFDGLPVPEFARGSLVFCVRTAEVSLTQLWDAVRRFVRCNVVQLGHNRRPMTMTRGIVQGDRLSVTLCDLLLADLQATRLAEFCCTGDGSSHLYRYVDDYLFVTTDRAAAKRFLATMDQGFQPYGMAVNRAKTETNVHEDNRHSGVVRFLGLRLNANTGEVSRDEGPLRRKRPLHFFDYGLDVRPGRALLAKISSAYQHPVPAALVARAVNSTATVVRNLASVVAYKAFAVVAAVKQYFFSTFNTRFLLKIVSRVAKIMYTKIGALIRHSAVTPMQCKWIVCEVYKKIFAKHFPARSDWVVARLCDLQAIIQRKCSTYVLKTALKRYDFTKIFD